MTARFCRPLAAVTVLLFIGLAHAASASESSVKITSGYDYSSGDYGQDVTTEIEYVPVTVEYLQEAWSGQITVPYISITGNGTVVPGTGSPSVSQDFSKGVFGGGGGGSSSSTSTVTHSGLGDVVASLAYAFFPESPVVPFIELRGKVKFGTADADKALGTGENDYSVQVDGVMGDGSWQPFWTIGYIMVGDTGDVDYNDGVFGTLGLMYKLDAKNSIGLAYDYQEASVSDVDDLGVVGAFVSSKFSHGWYATLNLSAGLTDSSLDQGGSVMFGREF